MNPTAGFTLQSTFLDITIKGTIVLIRKAILDQNFGSYKTVPCTFVTSTFFFLIEVTSTFFDQEDEFHTSLNNRWQIMLLLDEVVLFFFGVKVLIFCSTHVYP